jgi:hypothetical protein
VIIHGVGQSDRRQQRRTRAREIGFDKRDKGWVGWTAEEAETRGVERETWEFIETDGCVRVVMDREMDGRQGRVGARRERKRVTGAGAGQKRKTKCAVRRHVKRRTKWRKRSGRCNGAGEGATTVACTRGNRTTEQGNGPRGGVPGDVKEVGEGLFVVSNIGGGRRGDPGPRFWTV